MLAQVPLILEALTGTKISDLMARVPGLTAAGETSSTLNSVDENNPGEKTNGTRSTQPEDVVREESGQTNDIGTNPPENSFESISESDAQKGPAANVNSNVAPGNNSISNQRHEMCR